jgi:hypothetical protein
VSVVYRVDEGRMLTAAGRLSLGGGLALAAGLVLLLVGVLLAAWGVLAIALHTFPAGESHEIVAGVLVMILCLAPLALALGLVAVGAWCLVRASRLRMLRGLVLGRDSVSTVELLARSGRTERDLLALFAQAEKHSAAVRQDRRGA